jgi:glycosyltransferase involved in cell wall biosynthesis
LGIPENAFVIGNAGWLIHRKRFDVLLGVLARLQERQSLICVIAGDGPLRADLEALSSELGVSEQVIWLGWRKDLRDFYLALDVLVFNSDWDALGRTPIEALALGTPVVASVQNGGLAEVISDERYGFLTDQHNLEWLASKVQLLRDNAALRNSMVAAARTRIAESCSPLHDREKLAHLLCVD